jgi:hypothetical protein
MAMAKFLKDSQTPAMAQLLKRLKRIIVQLEMLSSTCRITKLELGGCSPPKTVVPLWNEACRVELSHCGMRLARALAQCQALTHLDLSRK